MAKKNEVIEIKPIKITEFDIKIAGTTPMIQHRWNDKAKRMMLEAQMGNKKGNTKEPKNPVADFINSMYWIEGKPDIEGLSPEECEAAFAEAIQGARFGFKAESFKQAAISAAYRMGWSKDKASLRGVFFIAPDVITDDGEQLVEIKSDIPRMREDMVRIGMGTADIRYRGEFRNWSATLRISFNENGNYDKPSIVNFINAGGYVCGVGEWRPEKDGQFGMFRVEG